MSRFRTSRAHLGLKLRISRIATPVRSSDSLFFYLLFISLFFGGKRRRRECWCQGPRLTATLALEGLSGIQILRLPTGPSRPRCEALEAVQGPGRVCGSREKGWKTSNRRGVLLCFLGSRLLFVFTAASRGRWNLTSGGSEIRGTATH